MISTAFPIQRRASILQATNISTGRHPADKLKVLRNEVMQIDDRTLVDKIFTRVLNVIENNTKFTVADKHYAAIVIKIQHLYNTNSFKTKT